MSRASPPPGKFWGVEHDLRVLRGAGLRAEGSPPFAAHFDYVWFGASALKLVRAQPSLGSGLGCSKPNSDPR